MLVIGAWVSDQILLLLFDKLLIGACISDETLHQVKSNGNTQIFTVL